MNSEQYQWNYKMLEETQEQHSRIKFYKIEKKHYSQISPYFLMRELQVKYFKNEQHAKSMVNLKLFNILQPYETIIYQNQILIIAKDWRQYRLNENQLYQLKIEFILLQLAIILNELSQKNITWYLYSLQQLYLIENCIFLQLIDLEDLHFNMAIQNIDIFKSFVRQQFPQFNQIQEMDNFEKIIKFLLSFVKGLKIDQANHYGLNQFFQINKKHSSYGLEDIYTVEFTTPKVFETVFNINSESILYRCYDQQKFDKKQILQLQNREIIITEKLPYTANILLNFSYLKVFDQAFFFQKKFIMTIAEAVQTEMIQQLDNETYRKVAYRALNDIIKGIAIFHKENIMHRNIQPSSIYTDSQNILETRFYIGDQEKAKEQINLGLGTQVCGSYQFIPPESMENISMKSDIFQFGLVALFILNKGTPLFSPTFLDSEEIEKILNPDYIQQQLQKQKFQYNSQLIQLISRCLKQNPLERPETNDLQNEISQIYRKSIIRIINKAQNN